MSTRLAVVPTIVIMLVAVYTTQLPAIQKEGFWFMANRIRTDFSMTLDFLYPPHRRSRVVVVRRLPRSESA